MTEEQLTLDQMQKELREMPSSPQRLRFCQEFVALADREQARAQQISGRYDLAWAYATAGDPAKALPVCAEFLQMQKETPNTSGKPHWEAVLAVNIACLACGPAPGRHAASDGGGLRRGRGRDQTADKVPALVREPLGPAAAVLFLSGGSQLLSGSQPTAPGNQAAPCAWLCRLPGRRRI